MGQDQNQNSFMAEAFALALKAAKLGEVPIGAVVVFEGNIIGWGHNTTRLGHNCTNHAEIVAIEQACAHLQNERLNDCDLYVTLEPCTMCAGAISFARVRRLYFGVSDPKGGAVESGVRFFEAATCHHAPDVYSGLMEQECAALLKDFFSEKRGL